MRRILLAIILLLGLSVAGFASDFRLVVDGSTLHAVRDELVRASRQLEMQNLSGYPLLEALAAREDLPALAGICRRLPGEGEPRAAVAGIRIRSAGLELDAFRQALSACGVELVEGGGLAGLTERPQGGMTGGADGSVEGKAGVNPAPVPHELRVILGEMQASEAFMKLEKIEPYEAREDYLKKMKESYARRLGKAPALPKGETGR